MTKTNVQPTPSNSQHHDTPNNKTHVIKFRVTAEEKASLELTCKLLNLSLSTFIRRAIQRHWKCWNLPALNLSLKKRNPFPCPRHKQKNSGAIMCRTSL